MPMDRKLPDQLVGFWQIVIAVVSALVNAAAWFFGYLKGLEGWRGLAVVLLGLLSTLSAMVAGCVVCVIADRIRLGSKRKQEELDSKLRLEKAKAFDYKLCAGIDSESFRYIIGRFDRPARDGVSKFSVLEMENDAVEIIYKNDMRYISCKDLLTSDNQWNEGFQSVPIRETDKYGKCIVQVSFVPLDREGNIPVIVRMPHAHAREINLSGTKGAHFTFVSFSPVPLRYEALFCPEDCYHREVRHGTIEEREPEELGLALKCEVSAEGKRRYYLFYVYKVCYPEVLFVGDDGELRHEVIDEIFASEEGNVSGSINYFRKDHDAIVAAATAADLRDGARESRCLDRIRSPALKKILVNSDFVISTMSYNADKKEKELLTDHYDMNKARYGLFEQRVLESFLSNQ